MSNLYSSRQAAEIVGITYRQLDNWVRNRVVVPSHGSSGSGHHRLWTWEEVKLLGLAREMARVSALDEIRDFMEVFQESFSSAAAWVTPGVLFYDTRGSWKMVSPSRLSSEMASRGDNIFCAVIYLDRLNSIMFSRKAVLEERSR